jgi:hypothetical protein
VLAAAASGQWKGNGDVQRSDMSDIDEQRQDDEEIDREREETRRAGEQSDDKGPSTPGPEGTPSEEQMEKELPGIPADAEKELQEDG